MTNTCRVKSLFLLATIFTVVLFVYPAMATGHEKDIILSIDYAVPHVSTAPANEGENVVLFLRERVQANERYKFKKFKKENKVVLFVHGGSVPVVPDFDFTFKDYSWAVFLARKGFDVFMMDLTGYGFSPRPKMTDPCNANPTQQDLLIPNPLDAPCDPSYAFNLSTIQSERDEINTVIEFIKELRGVERVNLIGWSGGGIRTGSYTSLNPQNVEKLIILASSNYSRTGSSNPPPLPQEGYPMRLQSYDALIYDRWFANVHCEDQVEPGAEDAAWAMIMPFDPLGSTWGTPEWNPIASPEGGLMRVPTRTNWGWNAEAAGNVEVPTLIMVGEFDGLLPSNQDLFEDLGAQKKVFIKIECASHFAVWEKQHTVLQKASLDWLLHSSIKGVKHGKMTADANGKINKDTD